MKDSVFDKAAKKFGETGARIDYDNAVNSYFFARYRKEEVYLVARLVDEETKEMRPGVADVSGRMLYVAVTDIDELGEGNVEGIMNIKLDELNDLIMNDYECEGIIFNPLNGGLVLTKDMIIEADRIY